MTSTNLGLGGNPVTFLGAYVANVSTSLSLQQSPSTTSVTLVEDLNVSPQVLFSKPILGSYQTLRVGSEFVFSGIITSYQEDIRNISGRQISVNMSDPREIMKSIPMILAPGYRGVISKIINTGCSVMDVFGAYDDFDNTGINLSGWNASGMTYERIALAFKGGAVTDVGFVFEVTGETAKGFGEVYRFNLDEVTARADASHRINTNLVSIADFIQELSNRYSFDWYVESSRNQQDDVIDVTIKIIDRSIDTIDIDLDTFLSDNEGKVVSAKRGFELRNELACSVLFGAPVEQMSALNITGLANNPIDLRPEGGTENYFMTENEMRAVLGTKLSWERWVDSAGGFGVYTIGGGLRNIPIVTPDGADVKTQLGINPERANAMEDEEALKGRIYEKLKGHAEATYGKRFLFQKQIDVDYIDAAWTADTVAGNDDPNEYFRNENGKTRAYVEFKPAGSILSPPVEGVLGFGGNFAFGKGLNAAQELDLDLRAVFDVNKTVTELDKADFIIKAPSLFVAATIEEGNIVRVDAPVIFFTPNPLDAASEVAGAGSGTIINTVLAGPISRGNKDRLKRVAIHGSEGSWGEMHAKAYQPATVFVPVRSKFSRYGPVVASGAGPSSQGKLLIENDDGYSPWEFGGVTLMNTAMQTKVNNSASSVKDIETADIVIEGFPKFSIGASLGQNSNISSINISFGGQVTTSYKLQSFLRKFGELSRDEAALLSLYARRAGSRTLSQNIPEFVERYRTQIARQFAGRGSSASSSNSGGAGAYE